MDISIENRSFWENAIASRRSVRSFERKAVDPIFMASLQTFTRKIAIPFPHQVETVFFKTRENYQLANNLKKPPEDGVAFVTQSDRIKNISAVGFVGELLILYAQGLGISSCWFGHYILDEIEQIVPCIDGIKENRPRLGYGNGRIEGNHAICISPLGYFKSDGLRLLDRITAAAMSFNRKPLSELLLNVQETSLPETIQFALDLARKAPSAANTQHWRFAVDLDKKLIKIKRLEGFKHFRWEHDEVDIGICAAHVWIGLMIQNIQCEVAQVEEADDVIWEITLR